MKLLNLLITICLLGSLSAQQTHSFQYRLDYIFPKTEDSQKDEIFAQHYLPAKYSSETKNSLVHFTTFSMSGGPTYVFLEGNQAIEIQAKDLDNNFKINSKNSYYDYSSAVETYYDKVELVKFDKAPLTVLNKTCTNYLVNTWMNDETQASEFVFCIDQTSEIDNVSFIFPNQQGSPIKGLLLAVTSKEEVVGEQLLLSNIEKISSTIKFDVTKELAAYQLEKEELEKMYNEEVQIADAAAIADSVDVSESWDNYYLNQPEFCTYSEFYNLKFETTASLDIASNYLSSLCSYSYYLVAGEEEKFKNFALKDIKSTTKNYQKAGLMSKKDAKLFYEFLKKDIENLKANEIGAADATVMAAGEAVEAAADAYAYAEEAYAYEDFYVTPYESVYATMKPEDSNFAIDNLAPDSEYWKSMPSYCKNLNSIIPNFSTDELKHHAKNYAGQICDMYLGEFDSSSVWYKGTFDAIRAEQKYFSNKRDELKNNDKKLLDEFLNSLD